MNCIFGHKWTCWSDPESIKIFDSDTSDKKAKDPNYDPLPIGHRLLQHRKCVKCKKIELHTLKVTF
jgi:hypothetical protein